MRKNLKEKLDQESRKEKIRKYIVRFSVGGCFLLFIFVLLPFFPQTSKNIQGIAAQLSTVLTDEGNKPIMIIKLDSGKTIRASMATTFPFKKGARVELLMKKSIMGIASYKVLHYTKTTNTE